MPPQRDELLVAGVLAAGRVHRPAPEEVLPLGRVRLGAPLLLEPEGRAVGGGAAEVEGHLAESWEIDPDGTQITFKLRKGVKWQNRPPVSGREFDAEDVVQSWNRYIAQPANNRASNANELNPAAPIVSVTSPDSGTVVVKLSEPTSYILQRFTSMVTGAIMPSMNAPMSRLEAAFSRSSPYCRHSSDKMPSSMARASSHSPR